MSKRVSNVTVGGGRGQTSGRVDSDPIKTDINARDTSEPYPRQEDRFQEIGTRTGRSQ